MIPGRTVPALTAQEAFDRVARHLLSMPRQSLFGDQCAYRAPDGNRCAIGCLIPDDVYSPDMEGSAVFSLFDSYPAFKSWQKILPLLGKLQRLHDKEVHWKTLNGRVLMRERLRDITSDFNLSPHVLDEMESAP